MQQMLQNSGCTVHSRNTVRGTVQYLIVQRPDLLIIDSSVDDERGVELCADIRADAQFLDLPICMIGEDFDGSPLEIAAFQAGVDDFMRVPIVPLVFLARVRQLIKRKLNQAIRAALNVQVSASELPGILQYVDAEKRTGRLIIRSNAREAVLTIREGNLVDAMMDGQPGGPEIITNVLFWPSSKVTLKEEKVRSDQGTFEHRLSGLLMKSCVEVDELNAMKKNLPARDAVFEEGEPLGDDCPKEKARLFELALNGYSVDGLLVNCDASEQDAIVWIHELVDGKNLTVRPSAFHDYAESCRKAYAQTKVHRSAKAIRAALNDLELKEKPQIRSGKKLPDWKRTLPQIFVVGDNDDHLQLLIKSIERVYANARQAESVSRQLASHTTGYQFDFRHNDKAAGFEVVVMPTIGNPAFGKALEEVMRSPIAALHVASAQDRRTSVKARRAHRVFRKTFQGVYCHVVPRVADNDGMFTFKISCSHCGSKLAVDSEEAGFNGECGVCSRAIVVLALGLVHAGLIKAVVSAVFSESNVGDVTLARGQSRLPSLLLFFLGRRQLRTLVPLNEIDVLFRVYFGTTECRNPQYQRRMTHPAAWPLHPVRNPKYRHQRPQCDADVANGAEEGRSHD